MKDHWKAIKFEPTNFVLAVEEDEDVNHGDVIIKDTPKFTPVKLNPEQTVPDDNLTAVALKNLPAQIPEREVRVPMSLSLVRACRQACVSSLAHGRPEVW